MKYITKKLIEDGLMANVITIRFEDGDSRCYIGDYWFNIDNEYDLTNAPFGVKTEKIKYILDAFYECPDVFADEYLYYYYYLCEYI